MKKYMNKGTVALFAMSFFFFGWMGHVLYENAHKIVKSSTLKKIQKDGVLNVVLLNSPSTYYIGSDGPKGFEYDLLNAYAKYLGVTLNVTTANTIKEALELSKNPDIQITSASLTKTTKREQTYIFGPSYFEAQEQLICHKSLTQDGRFPTSMDKLSNLSIVVGEDTSYSETIEQLKQDGFDINATYSPELSTDELIAQVDSHEIDCTIVDSNIYALNQRYFKNIELAFDVTNRRQQAWILAPDSDMLKAHMYEWLNSFNQSGEMARLKDHYYSYVLFFDYYDTAMFYKRIKTLLPKYEHYFKEASGKYNIPYSVLAALSYQESHWNPNAVSFTGVRGLMMLTQNTADLLGVKDRTDPKDSVFGGAKHLREMLTNIPAEVGGEERLKFALAAYNIGLGHVFDAQKLAQQLGLNQNSWTDLKVVLPLLSQKKYYKTLKHGYARGSEAVRYVDAIYDYRDILQKIDSETALLQK
ncbi:MAG: membrane-bound lytic murein transglycosylase MltF [Sulfurimonas sp.]|uniref:membrane-bound lytic murein transglycosylase MltF n=1 Tax=Sulfurimonas sp. TaxID=2022749 RepID=UPI002605ED41|nr:membrane-bound lytic murein transglycosylase MltF [Sulfurimonas sp.]MDD2651796.1 membrane-bound lytic murein transglycosylase MltF [Sulfurimonas sp.]MDD3451652.1 membrane-bound lytic murein transglycosylase MltF [Sulfurimonas sp.]